MMKGVKKLYTKTITVMYILISVGLVVNCMSANASATPNEDLLEAVKEGNLEAVQLALKNGADVNAQYSSGVTALMSAVRKGRVAIVKLLLDRNADVNATAEGGFTALMYAAYGGYADIAQLLLEKGADMHAQTTDGRTALMLATKKGHTDIVGLFQERGGQPAFTTNDLAEANRLGQEVVKLYQQGRYADAIPVAEELLELQEKIHGPEHTEVAASLSMLGMLYHAQGEYTKAEPLYKRALLIWEKASGPEHPDVAFGLGNLSELYRARGEYARAEPLCKRALVIQEKVLGPEHPQVAISLNNLALLYQAQGDYAQAEPLFNKALGIFEKTFGAEHPEVATGLSNLAGLYMSLGDYTKAEPLLKKALAIDEKTFGAEHPKVATSLNNLAELYRTLGEYAQAEPLYQRALKIVKKSLGPEHPYVAATLSNLALLYHDHGDYAKAELLFKQAIGIQEKSLGPEHPSVATDLNNLAWFYYSLGEYAKAESLFKKALAIFEKTLGPESPEVAINLSGLAELYRAIGEHVKAEPLLQRALTIQEQTLGPEHLQVAQSLNNLALHYMSLGEYTKAEPLLKKALAIQEKTLGPEHPEVATNLNNLGGLYNSLDEHARAIPFYKRALAIREKALGSGHSYVAISLYNLAGSYVALGNVEQAHNLCKQAQQFDEMLIDQVMGFTSEEQKLRFLVTKKGGLYAFLSLVSQYLPQSPSAKKDVLNIWLRRKGVILEAQKRFQEALIYSDDPKAVSTFQELSRVRVQLSRLVFAGPGKDKPDAYKQRIADLEAQKEELEAKLSRLSQAYAVKQKIAKADVEKVAKALPPNTVLIEFAKVLMFNFTAKRQEEWWNPAHYLAFILHAGNGEKVGLIDLGEADTIDRAVAAFKKQITRGRIDERSFKAIETSSEQVYKLVFAPLQAELGEVKEIFISPDSNLNLIPFEVLIGPDGRFLIEEYTFNYLAAGRDILGFGEIQEEGNNPLLMGDPDFDFLPTPSSSQADSGLTGKSTPLRPPQGGNEPTPGPSQEGNERRSVDMRGFHFKRLPWTKAEVEAIHALLGEDSTALYTGKDALEEVLLQTEAPRILHLATHGFFLEDQDLSEFMRDDPFRASDIYFKSDPQPPFALGPPVPAQFENPLLRSGIALAGANMATGEDGQTNGIVTAEKILSLKLRGTEMVVLSACETGLGDVQAGEGVFGLRRAFTQAGTKSLVMSLWSVPDKETQELMVQFYKNMSSGSMNRGQALRQAVLHQMQIVKDRYGYPHPLYWGAFVFLGEPDTPLSVTARQCEKTAQNIDVNLQAKKTPSDSVEDIKDKETEQKSGTRPQAEEIPADSVEAIKDVEAEQKFDTSSYTENTTSDTPVAAGTEAEEWTTCTEGEVQFLVPPTWKVIRHPEEGIMVQLTPETSSGDTFFAYLHRDVVPFLLELPPEEEQKIWREFAVRMQRFLERQGLTAVLKRDAITEIHTYKALDFSYEMSNPLGTTGFSRLAILMPTSDMFYGFMGVSMGDHQSEDRRIFEKILHSITIDESKIPTDIGSTSYSESMKKVKSGLDFIFQSMPPGWEWNLKFLEMGEGGHATELFIHLSLNRNDTLALVDGYAAVFNVLRKGIEPRANEIQCDPNMLNMFATQFVTIFGAAASNSAGNKNLPVTRIYIDVSDNQGNTSRQCFVDVNAFIKALQSNNMEKILQAMGCE